MVTLSSFDFWVPILVLLGVWVLIKGGFTGRMLLITLAVTIALTDGVVVNSLKKTFERVRPRDAQELRTVSFAKTTPRTLAIFHPLVEKTSEPQPNRPGRSLPSGHTANTFAVATVLVCFFGWRRFWPAYLLAAGVGYSRIYTASHWPSDVLVSIPLGILLGYLSFRLISTLWRRWGGSVAPGVYARHPTLISPAAPALS